MRRAPWKLIAGGLVLSVGGLAAVAGIPGRAGPVACGAPQEPEPAAPVIPPLPPVGHPAPSAPAPTLVLTPGDLPSIPPAPVPAPILVQVQATETAPMPRTAADTVLELRIPTAEPPALIQVGVIPPIPQTVPAATPKPAPADPTIPVVPDPIPVQFPTPPSTEKKLKVMLHLGDDRPRFEVRDGDEVYLKVVCDKVDVKSPSERGESMSVMKAVGKVAFVTPGGEGECDELSVVPGTGQVIVTGKVAFKYHWGKVETTVSGDRMTFRLGSAPGMAPPGPTTVSASYQKVK